MKTSGQVATASCVMSWLALAAAVLYVAAEILVFIEPNVMNAIGIVEMHHTGKKITDAIPLIYRLEALAIELLPTSLMAWALLELHKLFATYATGNVFSLASLAHLRRVATLIFWFVPLSFVLEAPVTYILNLGRGHVQAQLTLTSYDFSFLFMAGVMLVIARVMGEARRMADENAAFV
jgi:Protein of unknown function (DUF2975)